VRLQNGEDFAGAALFACPGQAQAKHGMPHPVLRFLKSQADQPGRAENVWGVDTVSVHR